MKDIVFIMKNHHGNVLLLGREERNQGMGKGM